MTVAGPILLAAAASAAQLTPQPEVARTGDALRLGHRLAACVVEQNRGGTVAMLREFPESHGEMIAAGRVFHTWRSCYQRFGESKDALATPRRAMRALLAEALYERDFSQGQPNASAAQLSGMTPPRNPGIRAEAVRLSALASSFADCVVSARAEDAAALLRTEPDSAEEEAAVQRLLPQFRPCLQTRAGFEINFPLFRGFVAEALYRRAAVTAVVQ